MLTLTFVVCIIALIAMFTQLTNIAIKRASRIFLVARIQGWHKIDPVELLHSTMDWTLIGLIGFSFINILQLIFLINPQ